MSLFAESVLQATGLLRAPDATTLRASYALLKELRDQLVAALDLEEQEHLYAVPERKSYFDKLSNQPDYKATRAFLDPIMEDEDVGSYLSLHLEARNLLIGTHPATSIDHVLGEIAVPSDPEAVRHWEHEVDMVEGRRICRDLAAGALMRETVEVFATVYPETYVMLKEALSDAHAKKGPKWMPPEWLETSIRVFLKAPWTGKVTSALKQDPAPQTAAASKVKIDTDDLKTRAQTAP